MKRRLEYRGSTPVLMEYLHEPPDPLPRPMNSAYLKREGYENDGNAYWRDEIAVWYDGATWHLYLSEARFKVETIEEFEKLVKI
jgi:hypothetical protein